MKIIEEQRDLFTVNKNISLVYLIAKDFRMVKGLPAKMNNRYKAMQITVKSAYKKEKDPDLRCIGFKPKVEDRYIYNLIVKNKFNDRCNYDDLLEALIQLKDDMVAMDVKQIAMPKIGIGDDGLNWAKVRENIELAFSDTDVEIIVCCSPLDRDNEPN